MKELGNTIYRFGVLWPRRFLELVLLTTGSATPFDRIPLLGGVGGHSLASRPRMLFVLAHGMWVFDDARVGLVQEPFVAGADTWLDRVVVDITAALAKSNG